MCIHTKERQQMTHNTRPKGHIAKKINGSKRIRSERALEQFLRSALKHIGYEVKHFKYYAVIDQDTSYKDLEFPSWSHIVFIRWNHQIIICSDSTMGLKKFFKENDIVPKFEFIQPTRSLSKVHKLGTYRQFSNWSLENSAKGDITKAATNSTSYDPLLNYAQDFLKKHNISFSDK